MDDGYRIGFHQEKSYLNNVNYSLQHFPIMLYGEVVKEANRRRHIGRYGPELMTLEEYASQLPKRKENKYT